MVKVERLKGKVAVVTGAGRGIGRAEAIGLAAEGAKVVVNDLGIGIDGTGSSSSPADETVAEIQRNGGQAIANYDSVATAEGGNRIIKTAIDNFGKLDILVNNAGYLTSRMVFNMTDEEWDIMMKVHLYGHFYCARPACVWFRQQKGGRIINTSSSAGLGTTGAIGYSAAKEGIVGFTRSVAMEMGKYGVTCNAIRPIAATSFASHPEALERFERVKDRSAMARGLLAEIDRSFPEDIAPLVVYLATDEASNVNGRTFLVCAGEVSIYSEPAPLKTVYKDGRWTVDELADIFSRTLGQGLINPAPTIKV